MQKIINIHQGVARMPEWRLAQPVDFQLCDGEHIAITGPNGGGKSMLVDMIIGRHPLLMQDPEYDFAPSTKPLAADNIKFITFKDNYGDTDGQYFLQLRWNQQEIDKETPVVGDLLEAAFKSSGDDTPERRQMQHTRSAHCRTEVGRARGEITELFVKGKPQALAERAVGAFCPRIGFLEHKTRRKALNAHVILLADHDVQLVFFVDNEHASFAVGGAAFGADGVILQRHLAV